MGHICCHSYENFNLICPTTLCSQTFTPAMFHILFDHDWRADLEDRRACDSEFLFETFGVRRTVHHSPCEPLAQMGYVHVIILLCACLFEVVVKRTKLLGQNVRLSLLFQLRFYFDNILK